MTRREPSIPVAGFAVFLGLAIAIGFGADRALISMLDVSNETHSGSEMSSALNAILGPRRPLELLIPTALGIIALVEAVESLRVEETSTTAIMAIALAVCGPFITLAAFMGFFVYGVNTAMLTGGAL